MIPQVNGDEGPHDYEYMDESETTKLHAPRQNGSVPSGEYEDIDEDKAFPPTGNPYPPSSHYELPPPSSDYELPPDGYPAEVAGEYHNIPEVPGTQPYEVPSDALLKARTLASPPRMLSSDYETPWDAKTL